MNSYADTNRQLWDLWTKLNAESDEYSCLLDQLKNGGTTLEAVELQEVGDVAGKSLLHLQCHLGLDTLSWAGQGARATGVDISEEAIGLARLLSRDLGIEADFVRSDIYNLPAILDRQFDIVYTSRGVLYWLSDLHRWAELVARYLKPGGTFYLLETHPIARVFLPRTDGQGKPVEWGYFDRGPLAVEERRSNQNPAPHAPHVAYYWPHSLGEIVTALCSAGLRLEFLHEFPAAVEERSFEQVEAERYEARIQRKVVIPGRFSIRAGL